MSGPPEQKIGSASEMVSKCKEAEADGPAGRGDLSSRQRLSDSRISLQWVPLAKLEETQEGDARHPAWG